MSRFLVLLLPFLLPALPVGAQSPEAAVDSLMAEYTAPGSPGGVVAVYEGGEVVFARGYGLANVEYNAPNTPTTPYHMASVSKQFTAFAVAMLAEQGLLSLDDDVRKYIPELHDFGPTITLRHLATHTSGLRDHWSLWTLSGGVMDDVIRQEDLMRLVLRQRELNFDPSAEFLYSNTGFLLLSEVVSRVTGQPFGECMAANVFGPLGMDDTQVYDDHERVVPGRAYSYYRDGDELKKAVLSYANSGATSLFTTAGDVAHWMHNFRTHEVGGASVARAMLERGVLTSGDTIPNALGLFIDEHRGLRRIQHGGADAGYRTFLAYYPEIDAGVVTMGNVASFDRRGIAERTAEAFFAADMDAPPPAPAVVEDAGPFELADPDCYTGTYIEEYGALEVARDGDRLTIAAVGGDPTTLRPLSDSVFVHEAWGIRFRFDLEPDGTTDGGVLLLSTPVPFERFEAPAMTETERAALRGTYASEELGTEYVIRSEDGALVVAHRRLGDAPLVALPDDRFSAGPLGIIAFVRGADEAVTGFRASGGRVRNLLFERVN